MDIKEKLHDVVRHIVGQGEEVRFKNEVAEHAKTTGVTQERATKELLVRRMQNVHIEISANSHIDSESKDYKALMGALNETFGTVQLQQFREDSANTALFRNIAVPPPTPAEIKQILKKFAQKNKKLPAMGVVNDCSDNTKLIDQVMSRFSTDRRLMGADSIQDIVMANPELGADLGKIFEAKKAIERHEKLFKKDLRFEQSIQDFKDTAQCSITEMLWKAPTDFIAAIIKKGFNPKNVIGSFGTIVKETARFAGREAWAGTKILGRTAQVAGSFLRNKVSR